MLRKKKSLLIGCMIIIATGSISLFGQQKIELKDKRITIQMADRSLYTVFTRLINKYDIAVGIEESILDRDHRDYYFDTNVPPDKWKTEYNGDKEFLSPTRGLGYEHLISVNFENARLEDVMNAIVRQMDNYEWEINDDVVNVFPVRGRDERLKSLLDIKVRVFFVGMGADVGSIQAQLMLFLPEFKTFLEENKLYASTSGPGSSFDNRILPDGMRFTNMTFKELLNSITKSKRGGWMLQIKRQKDKPGKEFIEIGI